MASSTAERSWSGRRSSYSSICPRSGTWLGVTGVAASSVLILITLVDVPLVLRGRSGLDACSCWTAALHPSLLRIVRSAWAANAM